MSKRAIITGITGQDGSYLAELLLSKGYEVLGIVRRAGSPATSRIQHLIDDPRFRRRLTLRSGNLVDESSLRQAVADFEPHEFYNLAAMSFVHASWDQPMLTSQVNSLGVLRALEAIRELSRKTRFYQASSSEMFGNVKERPQHELTRLCPRSPYGVSKAYAHHLTVNYRESYDLYAVSGILFNHESPRRGLEFVTRKISDGVARIKLKKARKLELGNLKARRDWGHASDYVEAMWLMLQQDRPDDYVIATGEDHSVREFAQIAFAHAGLRWQDHVRVSKKHMRRAEIPLLVGDASKARRKLGWKPRHTFVQLVHELVDSDIERHSRLRSRR